MNYGVYVNHSRLCVHFAQCFDALDGHPAERAFEFGIAAFGEGIHPAHVGRRRRKKSDFVNRCKKMRRLRSGYDVLGNGSTIINESTAAITGEGVAIVWKSIMAEIPDSRNPAVVHRRDHRIEAGPIILPLTLVHDGPTNGLADYTDPEIHQRVIISSQMAVVSRNDRVVFPLPILPDEGRALEAGHEESREYCLFGFPKFVS